jgi:ribonuclease BN (tRNA processing enzyme)
MTSGKGGTRGRPSSGYASIELDVWGARGSRSLTPPVSRIANYTSCYSLRAGADLFVLDGGRGLGVLSHALVAGSRFREVERVHLLLSHSHMDHWEGLKDATWFWENGNGLELTVLGAREALETVNRGYAHPAYVPLEILASRTLARLGFEELRSGERRRILGFSVECFSLNHYSGAGDEKNHLDTLGYRIESPDGFALAYLCDHEPTEATAAGEHRMIEGARVAIVDAHFADRSQHAYGHGSQEHAAHLARSHPRTLVLAGHHGPTESDAVIRRAHSKHGKGLANFALATEGMRLAWSIRQQRLRLAQPEARASRSLSLPARRL